jgi:hypothetical protein
MISSWIENLILLTAGLLGWPVAEGLIACQAVPARALRNQALQTAGPPGRNRGAPVTAARFILRAVRR